MLDSADVTPLDGRTARSHRTRIAIVDALIGLLEDGQVQPTVEDIAVRAGVAPRTVFQHYADRETLFAAVGERRQATLEALMGRVDAGASLDARIDAIVAQRAQLYEWITPVRRAALQMEPFSASVQASLAGFRAVKRAEAVRVFAAEVAALGDDERTALEDAIGVATSYATWQALRAHQGLDADRASAALRRTLRALLTCG
jgi:TetR/AcrR family transcriptional regulator of autoinduction and epiphytic fitness